MMSGLDGEVFDADNHMYETADALTKFLPKRYERAIEFVEIRGRTKIMVRGKVSEYIPNPTFDVVAAPGAQEDYFKNGNPKGLSFREFLGSPIRCLPGFREPAPRIELMDELGIDRALMFPTLASLIEERLKEDPDAILAVVHALNEWMYETWTFNYHDRIFATPVINMSVVDRALEEIDWVIEHGARCVLIRPAPVAGYRGSRSPGLPEFDPVWARLEEAGILVGMHSSDSGYAELANRWEGDSEFLPFRPSAFRIISQGKRPIEDTMTAMVVHGALTRFPDLKVACVENGAMWVGHLFQGFEDAYRKMPQEFLEDPLVAFRRNIYVNPFWEDDISDLIGLMGADHVLFGSDYPHPEGLRDPVSYVDKLDGLPPEDIAKIMGGNLGGLMKVPSQV